MFTWLATLPLLWQIMLPVLVILAIVAISIWGNAVINWGKKTIGFGKNKNSKYLTCSQCRQLVMVKTMKYKTDRNIIQESVIRDQMNYVDMKLHEIYLDLCRSYREQIVKNRQPGVKIDYSREQKEYMIYQESLGNSFNLINKELLRSMKENGFCEMGPVEYTHYCKERTKALVTISREYLMSRYPFENMIIPLQDRFSILDINKIETYVFNIYDRAKEITIDANIELDKIDKEFDEYIKHLSE